MAVGWFLLFTVQMMFGLWFSLKVHGLQIGKSLTYGIPPEFRGASIYLFKTVIRHRVSPEFIGSRNYDGVHCRESAGTGPVNLQVVPNEWQVTMDQFICAPQVGSMLKVCTVLSAVFVARVTSWSVKSSNYCTKASRIVMQYNPHK